VSHRLEPVDPEALGAPRGYSHGILAPAGSRLLFVAGQVGWNEAQEIVGDDFVVQFEQALANVVAVVEEAGGTPRHVARLTLYVTDKSLYVDNLSRVGEAYRRRMGRHYPAMALVEVRSLLEPGALIEIEATAALPPEERA